jgi:hypothetical protein
MTKQERKRLEKLQSEATKEAGDSYLEKLYFPDLLLLLRHDEELRALIRSIVERPAEEEDSADVQEAPEEIVDEPVEAPPPKPVIQTFWPIPAPPPAPPPPAPVDPLRRQLATQLALLQAVRADEELASQWLGTGQEDEGHQLVRLIARVSQWDTVVDLWDLLANRCKQGKRAASLAEHQILAAALAAHNLRWTGRQAVFRHVEVGAAYDFRHHQRGTSTGDTVRAEWLPGLTNAGGEMQKPPLVQT